MDTELHFSTTILDNVGIQSAVAITPMAVIVQGVDDNQRTGIQVGLRRFEIKFTAERGNVDTCMRVILLVDRQVNGLIFTAADLFQTTTTADIQVTSPFNNDNKRRFRIVSDRYMTFVDGHSNKRCWSMRHTFKHNMRFDGIGPAIADVVSGMPYVVLLTDELGGAAAVATTFVSRLWFAP